MTIKVQGFAQYHPILDGNDPIFYKTPVFEITDGTSYSELYSYFEANPSIYYLYPEPIPKTWGLNDIEDVIHYTQINNTWGTTNLPQNPHVLRWNFVQVERNDGTGTKPLIDITTPINNIKHYEAD